LSLESDILGPLDESGQVLLGGGDHHLDVSLVQACGQGVRTDTEGLGLLLEKGVLGGLGDLLGAV